MQQLYSTRTSSHDETSPQHMSKTTSSHSHDIYDHDPHQHCRTMGLLPTHTGMAETSPYHLDDGCSPYHFQVYHRLATILLGLVTVANQYQKNNDDKQTTLLLLQQTRCLAQRILKDGRMKGGYGATQYYCWFTAVAGECSEALCDTVCAQLAYKSIAKLESFMLLYPHDGGMINTKVHVVIVNNKDHNDKDDDVEEEEEKKDVIENDENSKNALFWYYVYGRYDGISSNKYNGITSLDDNDENVHGTGRNNHEVVGVNSMMPPLMGAVISPTLQEFDLVNINNVKKDVTTFTTDSKMIWYPMVP
jgi:hypothetical protein